MLEAGEVAGCSPPTDGTGLPVNVWVMSTEPRKTQDERQVRMIQNVELDALVVIPGQEHRNLGGLVCDGAESVAIKAPNRNWSRKRNPSEPQLPGQLLTDDTSVGARVYQGSQGVGTVRKEEPGMEKGSLGLGR